MTNAADVQPMEAACLIAVAQGHNLDGDSPTITDAGEALRGYGLLDADNRLTQDGRLCVAAITPICQREIARFSSDGPRA